jgi:hypothetical protein
MRVSWDVIDLNCYLISTSLTVRQNKLERLSLASSLGKSNICGYGCNIPITVYPLNVSSWPCNHISDLLGTNTIAYLVQFLSVTKKKSFMLLAPGTSCKLTCSTEAGHPPAKLAWFRGHHMMESHYKVQVKWLFVRRYYRFKRCHDAQHNDIKHNNIQHNGM